MKINNATQDRRYTKTTNWNGLLVKVGATKISKRYFNSNGHYKDPQSINPTNLLDKEYKQFRELKRDLKRLYDPKITDNSARCIYNLMMKKSLLVDQAYTEWKRKNYHISSLNSC